MKLSSQSVQLAVKSGNKTQVTADCWAASLYLCLGQKVALEQPEKLQLKAIKHAQRSQKTQNVDIQSVYIIEDRFPVDLTESWPYLNHSDQLVSSFIPHGLVVLRAFV